MNFFLLCLLFIFFPSYIINFASNHGTITVLCDSVGGMRVCTSVCVYVYVCYVLNTFLFKLTVSVYLSETKINK